MVSTSARFIDLTDTMADTDIQEVGASMTCNDKTQGDLNRLQREVVDSISFESADVNNVSSLLHIPFDYEELMRDSTDEEDIDASVVEQEMVRYDCIESNVQNDAIIENIDNTVDALENVSKDNTIANSHNIDVVCNNNDGVLDVQTEGQSADTAITSLEPKPDGNDPNDISHNNDQTQEDLSNVLGTADTNANEINTNKTNCTGVTGHNITHSHVVLDENCDNDKFTGGCNDVHGTEMETQNINEMCAMPKSHNQKNRHLDSIITSLKASLENNDGIGINDYSSEDDEAQDGSDASHNTVDDLSDRDSQQSEDTINVNDKSMKDDSDETELCNQRSDNSDAIETDDEENSDDNKSTNSDNQDPDQTRAMLSINVLTVKGDTTGIAVVDKSVLTVKKVVLDVPDLKRDLNCVVRMKRLTEDLNLWKPMPEPLESDLDVSEVSTDSMLVQNKSCRRNPSRRARDSVDYVACQNETESDDELSDHNTDELFEPVNKRAKTENIGLREPSKSRIEAQQLIAMKKAALALLKLRNSSGGGTNSADKDLQDLSESGTKQRMDYALEYDRLTKMIEPLEKATEDLNTNPSHNNSESEEQVSLLPAITPDNTDNNELCATTGGSMLNVITNTTNNTDELNDEDLNKSDERNTSDDIERENDDTNDSVKDKENTTSVEEPIVKSRRKRKTRNVTKNTTYKTKDESGSSGELNIQFKGRPRYKRKRKYTCTPCNKGFSNQKDFNQHYIDDHGMLHCKTCGKPFQTPSALRKHQYQHSDVKIPCTKCDQEFPFQSQLDSHMIKHRDQATYKCMAKGCPKWFKDKGDLTKHLKNIPEMCTCVNFVTTRQTALKI